MFFINERFIASENQTIFNISYPYINGALKVSINGLDLSITDFVQNGRTKVQLKNPCNEGDTVQIYSTYSANNISVKVIGNRPNSATSVFSKYGEVEKIKYNHRYKVSLVVDGQKDTSSFISTINPCHSTINKIRLDTGDLLDDISDEKILTMIYLNSKECDDLTEENDDVNVKHKKLWVRYKTDMDLVHVIYLSISGKRGMVVKKLGGTVDIQRKIDVPYLKDMIGRFKEKFEQADDLINSNAVTFKKMVKAGNSSYPVTVGRLF